MKSLKAKASQKTEREKEVLIGMIELFLETAKPVGSVTLKENGFEHLSSATIRNYFSKLEQEGYLEQQHSSGGRIPTEKAFRFYAQEFSSEGIIPSYALEKIDQVRQLETKEINLIIRQAVENLSSLTHSATFISSPKFDQDFVTEIKILPIDARRTLLVLLTNFGSIQTETLFLDEKLSNFSAKRIESYLNFRLTGQSNPEPLSAKEETLASRFYNEGIVRFFVGYSNFSSDEMIRTGFSTMLQYPEFREASSLASVLSLFENTLALRHLVRDTISHRELKFWIGEDLRSFGAKSQETTILSIPYYINSQAIGAIGILGPTRIPYRKHFGILKAMSHALSVAITNNLYKFQVTYRQPEPTQKLLEISYKPTHLIESKKGM